MSHWFWAGAIYCVLDSIFEILLRASFILNKHIVVYLFWIHFLPFGLWEKSKIRGMIKISEINKRKWMENVSQYTHLSPSWPRKNVPITSPIRFNANVFVWYISFEHTQSSWDTIVLWYHFLSYSRTAQSTTIGKMASKIKKKREKKMFEEKLIFGPICVTGRRQPAQNNMYRYTGNHNKKK